MPIGLAHAEHLPRSASQLTTGMFSYQRIWWPQWLQRERGTIRLNGAAAGAGWPCRSAHSAAHCRSMIFGRR